MVSRAIRDKVLTALEGGLSLVPRPYEALARSIDVRESDALEALAQLQADGTISRFGVIVRHHELGYRANCMVVWDVPDATVSEVGKRMASLPFVTLCYRRPRRPPQWPFNLFCMIHGRDRGEVESQVEETARTCGLTEVDRALLFSTRRFKQRGARYRKAG